MPGNEDANDKPNGRVTTREFYNALLGVKDEMGDIKTGVASLNTKMDIVCKTSEDNRDDITDIKRQSNRLDAGVLVISAIWTGAVAWWTGK